MKDVGVVLFGRLKDDAEAPRRVCLSKEPCTECKKLMELGIILISVDEKKSDGDMQNPYRTGGWCVVKEEAVCRLFEGGPILDSILKYRMTFIEDEAWDKIGLPRGETNAQTLPREGEAPTGEEREVVGDLVGNDWREGTAAAELEGMKMVVFLQKISGADETEEHALAGWRAMTDDEREQTKLAYQALQGDDDADT